MDRQPQRADASEELAGAGLGETHPTGSASPEAPSPVAIAGWCEAAARLLAPLLSSPLVKARLRIILVHLDPDHAPGLVRTFFRTDPEIPLATISALPRLANLLMEASAELTRLLGAYPRALLGATVESLQGELRPRRLGEALGRALALALAIPSDGRAPALFWSELAAGFNYGLGAPDIQRGRSNAPSALQAQGEGLASALASIIAANPELVTSAISSICESLRRHPTILREALAPLLVPLHEALHEAGGAPPSSPSPEEGGSR
ncbi:MAG: hypothetical protein RBU30_08190 [Polyangia bacterium]|jgi:hypothetical protein|nr:hypothetical protein [Polyangia bacterium]